MKKLITFFLFLILFTGCEATSVQNIENQEFMLGTWKAEGRSEYEVWEKQSTEHYQGYAYRIVDGEKQTSERMQVKKLNNTWQLTVRVPEQNEGQSVVFTLRPSNADEWLFENLKHDFPKQILYKKISNEKWLADVRGDDNKGFSYHLELQ